MGTTFANLDISFISPLQCNTKFKKIVKKIQKLIKERKYTYKWEMICKNLTKDYKKNYITEKDLRNLTENKVSDLYNVKKYTQVFSNKNGFINNLSIIDLIFNEGPNSISFLK